VFSTCDPPRTYLFVSSFLRGLLRVYLHLNGSLHSSFLPWRRPCVSVRGSFFPSEVCGPGPWSGIRLRDPAEIYWILGILPQRNAPKRSLSTCAFLVPEDLLAGDSSFSLVVPCLCPGVAPGITIRDTAGAAEAAGRGPSTDFTMPLGCTIVRATPGYRHPAGRGGFSETGRPPREGEGKKKKSWKPRPHTMPSCRPFQEQGETTFFAPGAGIHR